MPDESTALVPLEERSVDFYGDQVVAVLVEVDGQPQTYIPLRPICEYLGLAWNGQFERLKRDPVLSEALKGIRLTRTPSGARGGGPQETLCLPVDYLNGWLFGVQASRVKEELRDKVIRYQRDCYRVLARAFQADALTRQEPPAPATSLAQIRALGLAIAQLAEQQMALETRLGEVDDLASSAHTRLDRAAEVVNALQRRLTAVEGRVSPASYITDEQAAAISAEVKALAELLTANDTATQAGQAQGSAALPGQVERGSSQNHYQSVFAELYRRFGVSSYKLVRQDQYETVLRFLEDWRRIIAPQPS